MNCSKISVIYILLFLSSYTVSSQNIRIDSLIQIVDSIQDKTEKVNTYTDFAEKYLRNNPDIAKTCAQKALDLAKEIKYIEGEVHAYQYLVNIYLLVSEYDKAFDYANKALSLSKKIKDKSFLATSYHFMALYYHEINNYTEAIKYYHLSEEINKKIKNLPKLAGNYANLGSSYTSLGQNEKGLGYYIKAVQAYEKSKDEQSLAIVYNNLAILLTDLERESEAIDYYKKAIKLNIRNNSMIDLASNYNNAATVYKEFGGFKIAEEDYKKSININKKLGSKSSLAQNYMNLAVLANKQNQTEKALEYYSQSLAICKNINLNIGLVYNYLNRSDVFKKMKRYKDAEKDLLESELLLQELNQPKLTTYLYEKKYELYKETKKYDLALANFEKFEARKDSFNSKEKEIAVEDIKTKYETEKTLNENDILREQNILKANTIKSQQLLWFATSAALLLFVILTMVLINTRKRQRINMQKLIQLNKDNIAKSEQLIELNAQKDKFFSIIAHDLKNPFHLLLGYSNLLIKDIHDKKYNEIEYFSKLISKSAKTGNDLLDNLMEWSRSQSGKITISPKVIDLLELTTKSIKMFEINAFDKNITIHNRITKQCQVYADYNTLSTIIRNLVANAIKFTHEGGVIILSCKEENKEVVICVKDNGIGINAEDLHTIFTLDKEHTSLGTNDERGTGLGLIICKEFAAKNNAELSVESTPGIGSTFCIRFNKN